MGLAKADLARMEGLEGQAHDVLLRAGAIETCPFHSYVWMTKADTEAERRAYAMGTNMVRAGEIDGTREEFMDTIKRVLDDSAWDCPACQKNAED